MSTHVAAAASIGIVALVGALGATPAWAREQVSVDVSAGVAGSTNPFLETRDNTGSASAFVEVSPLLTMEDEVSSLSLRGFARLEQYARRRYSSDQSGAIDLNVTRRQTDRLSLRAGAAFRTTRGGAQNFLTAQPLSLEPLPGLVQELGGLSVIGRRLRTTTASARIGATYLLSGTQSLDGDFAVGMIRNSDPRLFDYRFANQEIGYSHGLSDRTWLRASLGFGQVDYLDRKAGDSLIVTPTIGFVRQLSERTKASLSAGPTFSRVRRLDGSHDGSTGWAVRGNLCNEQAQGRLCIDVDRSSQPTVFGDVSTITNFRLVGSRRLSSRDTIDVTGKAIRTVDASDIAGRGERVWVVGASAGLTRQFDQRLALFGRASFADIYDSGASRQADVRGEIGVRYRFGATR
jgi:hypothetical protein